MIGKPHGPNRSSDYRSEMVVESLVYAGLIDAKRPGRRRRTPATFSSAGRKPVHQPAHEHGPRLAPAVEWYPRATPISPSSARAGTDRMQDADTLTGQLWRTSRARRHDRRTERLPAGGLDAAASHVERGFAASGLATRRLPVDIPDDSRFRCAPQTVWNVEAEKPGGDLACEALVIGAH